MSDFKQQLSDDDKIYYIRALLRILNNGKKLNPQQKAYIKRQAEDLNLSAKELREIKPALDDNALIKDLKRVSNACLRRYILREMIMLALSDHEISDQEMADIYAIGMGAGVQEDKINDFFLWVAKGLEWQLEGECLIEN